MFLELVLSSIAYTTPLMLAGLGGFFSEKVGVVNIALEGEMLIGAFFAVAGSWWTGSLFFGLLCAIAAGAIVGLIHGVASVFLNCDHIVSGVAINILALGVTGYFIKVIFGVSGATPSVGTLEPVMGGIPWLFLSAIILIVLTHLWSKFTVSGLRHRTCGESVRSAITAGLAVKKIRLSGTVVAGVLAGLGGAHLSLGDLGSFVERMTAGRGFIALAALILARWKPLYLLITSFFFGFIEAFSEILEVIFPDMPSDLVLLIPFVITLIALAGFIGEIRIPRDLGKSIRI
jgi:ABC-type uncharacterized transport system permease subunit